MRKRKYSTPYYHFSTSVFVDSLLIHMVVSSLVVKTRFLPQTSQFLQMHAPAVLTTKCFNKKNLSFAEEVKDTEFGHLFEHMLIGYIYLLKLANGETTCICDGRTNWDWKINPYGSFLITVHTSKTDPLLFDLAIEKTVTLCEKLFLAHSNESSNEILYAASDSLSNATCRSRASSSAS